MNNIIHKLRGLIDKKHLTTVAQKRLIRDLEAVYRRLEKDEYETSGITENIFDVPDKTKQFYAHLKTYTRIGKTWSQILNNLPIHEHDEVVDICPGYAPKVEIGLFYINYKGKIIVLDRDLESITALIKFMELFHPQFNMVPYAHNLFIPTKNQFSFVIGNHIIDDLVLCYFADKHGLSTRELYEKEGAFIKMWNKILENERENGEEITNKLARILKALIRDNGYLCLAQYKSYMERMLSLDKPHIFSQKVFTQLVKNLCSAGFVELISLVNGSNDKNMYFGIQETAILKKK